MTDGGRKGGGVAREISAQVFGTSRPPRRGRLLIAAFVALAAHALFAGWARFGGPSLSGWGADLAVRVHAYLRHREKASTRVSIERPRPAAPKAPETPAPVPKTPRTKAAVAVASPRPARARARAGRVLTAKADPNAPVDLSGGIVTGDADRYAGGVTAATGRSKTAVAGDARDTRRAGNKRARPTRFAPRLRRRVSLAGQRWSCPWPARADAENIDATSVLIRARVAADGRVESVTVLSDPGFGFAAAAKRCALRTRFRPALDARGRAVRSLSPPIRVRFSR